MPITDSTRVSDAIHDSCPDVRTEPSFAVPHFPKLLNVIYDRWSEYLFFCLDVVTMRLDTYCDAVKRKGGSVAGVLASFDDTKVATCRITGKDNHQEQLFSGHKRPLPQLPRPDCTGRSVCSLLGCGGEKYTRKNIAPPQRSSRVP